MKRKVITALLFILFLLLPNTVKAEDTDCIKIYADTSMMPADTAYIDILGRISPDSGYYTPFNEAYAPVMFKADDDTNSDGTAISDINENSSIAKYNEDGYMSLGTHLKYSSRINVYTDESGRFTGETFEFAFAGADKEVGDMNAVYKKFGRFKAAYVSADGKVLGVTDIAASELSEESVRSLTLDGTSAVYRFYSDKAGNMNTLKDPAALTSLAVVVMFFIMIIALGIIIIRNLAVIFGKIKRKK